MKKKIIKHAIIVVVLFLIEILFFNYRYWLHIADREVSANYEVVKGKELKSADGFSINPKSGYIQVETGNIEIKSVRVAITDVSQKSTGNLKIKVKVIDEGHYDYYDVGNRVIFDDIPNSQWMEISPFGKVKEMRIYLDESNKKNVRIDSIRLNSHPDFSFSLVRLLILLGIYAIFALVKEFYSVEYDSKKLTHNLMLVATSLAMFFLLWCFQKPIANDDSKEYGELAIALSEGKVWLSEVPDEKLIALENPYDRGLRDAEEVTYLWDHAYYQGKYYVYFGVTPAILFYLPYYLITGKTLTHYRVDVILFFIIAMATALLVRNLYIRYGGKIKLWLMLFLNVAFIAGGGAILFVKRAAVYHVAQGTGLALTICGLALWLWSTTNEKHKINIILLQIGSLCMALSVGCRPQYALYSFLAFPIFWEWLGKSFKDFVKNGCLVVAAYVPVAAGLMYYNLVRFGSVADFGANYNLTSYDMVHMGLHWERIRGGLWYYLLKTPRLNYEFPFLISDRYEMAYPGYIYNEKQIYGILWGIPLILAIFMYGRVRKQAKENKSAIMYWICIFITVFLPVFDVVLCGIVVRYQMDFRLSALLAALLVIFTLLSSEKNETVHKQAEVVFGVLCVLTMLMAVLTVFSQYEANDYLSKATLWYNEMKFTFGIFNY